ncbi:MAG: NTP pyrophosphohydrolase [Actinomycetota bacterium]|nr:NTP pyrophosphohydrolase [Actinomycetota bacterium]
MERVRASAAAGRLAPPVVVVLEGKARGGVEPGVADGVEVLHASGGGDDSLLAVTADATGRVTLVSADRALCRRAGALGANVVRPGWLIDRLDTLSG